MVNARLRTALAGLVVAASAVPGLVLASPASAADALDVTPVGGCWTYQPATDAEYDDAAGGVDLSAGLEDWADDPTISLSTTGATAVGGEREFTLTIPEGPLVQPGPSIAAEGEGTAYAVLSLNGTELPQPVAIDLAVPVSDTPPTGVAVPELTFEGTFPIADAGTNTLTLEALYVELPDLGAGLRIACNGQDEGVSGGDNPATQPVATNVAADFAAVPSTGVVLSGISDQAVRDAARVGDTLHLAAVGLPASATSTLAFCTPSDPLACFPAGTVEASPTGGWVRDLVIGENVAVIGETFRLRVTTGSQVTDLPLRLLAAPALAVSGKGKGKKWRAVVTGTGWDPLRPVRLRPFGADGDPVRNPTVVTAAADGTLSAQVRLGKVEATTLRAVQDRLPAALSGEAALTPPETATPPPADSGSDSAAPPAASSGATTSAGSTTNAAAATVEIPQPVSMPIDQVPAPTDPSADPDAPGAADPAGVNDLAVTGVILDGSSSAGELFGASPRRVLKITVENIGDQVVTAPGLKIAVGRTGDVEPIYSSDGLGRIEPGATAVIEVPIGLGVGAIGTYQISGQVGTGEGGTFSLTWQSYPWGLIGLNVLGLALVVWAVNRRVQAHRGPAMVAAIAPPSVVQGVGAVPADPGEAVIDLDTLERWWALQSSGTAAVDAMLPVGAGAGAGAGAPLDLDAVVDIDAVEQWLGRVASRGAAEP